MKTLPVRVGDWLRRHRVVRGAMAGLVDWLRRHRVVRGAMAGLVAVTGALVALFTLAVGHCSAFGGTCPADPQPWWEDDVFGGVAIGIGVGVAAITFAVRPNRRGLAIGAVLGAASGLVLGLWARGAASTFW